MPITLAEPVAVEKVDAPPAPPLVPVDGGDPITVGTVVLAVCAREGGKPVLCRESTRGKGADAVKKWTPTGRVEDIARAYVGGLLVPA